MEKSTDETDAKATRARVPLVRGSGEVEVEKERADSRGGRALAGGARLTTVRSPGSFAAVVRGADRARGKGARVGRPSFVVCVPQRRVSSDGCRFPRRRARRERLYLRSGPRGGRRPRSVKEQNRFYRNRPMIPSKLNSPFSQSGHQNKHHSRSRRIGIRRKQHRT